jgi:hypothetical protein
MFLILETEKIRLEARHKKKSEVRKESSQGKRKPMRKQMR